LVIWVARDHAWPKKTDKRARYMIIHDNST
jgi:hypothetical protein